MLHQLDPAFNIGVLKPVNGGTGLPLIKVFTVLQEGFARLTGVTTVRQDAGLVALLTVQMTIAGGDFLEFESSFSGTNDQAHGITRFALACPNTVGASQPTIEGAKVISTVANDPFSGAIITRIPLIAAGNVGTTQNFQLLWQQITGAAGALASIDPTLASGHVGNATLRVREVKAFNG